MDKGSDYLTGDGWGTIIYANPQTHWFMLSDHYEKPWRVLCEQAEHDQAQAPMTLERYLQSENREEQINTRCCSSCLREMLKRQVKTDNNPGGLYAYVPIYFDEQDEGSVPLFMFDCLSVVSKQGALKNAMRQNYPERVVGVVTFVWGVGHFDSPESIMHNAQFE